MPVTPSSWLGGHLGLFENARLVSLQPVRFD
jgi:hypothetical protein